MAGAGLYILSRARMTETRTYHGITLDIVRSSTERICYIILPEGLKDDGRAWMEQAAERFSCSIVAMSGMDWNSALTPWRADGVFKKSKPFTGNADLFLKDLCGDYFPSIELQLGLKHPERFLAGVSLSGLFAIWSVFRCESFVGIASVSGSLWYDGFASWTKEQTPSASVRKVFVSLGDREKKSKDRRMATVEEMTLQIVDNLMEKGVRTEFALEENKTHFSPVVPRLEKALESLFSDSLTGIYTDENAV